VEAGLNAKRWKPDAADEAVRKGLVFERRFTDGKTSALTWWMEKRTALIEMKREPDLPPGRRGGSQELSQRTISSQQIFPRKPGNQRSRKSVRQLISRVANTLCAGEMKRYFAMPSPATLFR